MTNHTVEKIGGTSIAATDTVLKNVLIGGREGADLFNRVFVVSAYAGMTNRLLKHKKTGEPGIFARFANSESDHGWHEALSRTWNAMQEINADVFAESSVRAMADDFLRERIEGTRNCLIDLQRLCSYGHFTLDSHLTTVCEMLAALGEAHSAYNTSLLLNQKGVNACFVDLTGWRDDRNLLLDERIEEAWADIDVTSQLPIVTGYAHCKDGMIERFGRGYTEVTFSRLAVVTGAREAIIHKEFHLSSADPKRIGMDKVRKIGRTNYDVADQLSNMGMEAVHPRAAKGLRQADIPLRVKNTFDPEDGGTVFSGDYVSESPQAEIVTGLSSIFALELFEQDMVGVKGYDAAALEVLTRHKIRIVTKCSNANTIVHYVAGSLKLLKRVVADLEERFPGADVTIRKVSIVSVIGSDLKVTGLTATAMSALADEGIEVLGVHQLPRSVDLQVVVSEDDFDMALKALHRVLIENDPAGGDAKVETPPETGKPKSGSVQAAA